GGPGRRRRHRRHARGASGPARCHRRHRPAGQGRPDAVVGRDAHRPHGHDEPVLRVSMTGSGWLVVFDCDGVLVDSERLNVQTWTAMMLDAGIDFTEDDAVQTFVGKAYADNRVTI